MKHNSIFLVMFLQSVSRFVDADHRPLINRVKKKKKRKQIFERKKETIRRCALK
jgi:shikimate kinase